MNWTTYKFSKESESDLEEYLSVVAKTRSKLSVEDQAFKEAWQRFLPVDEEIKLKFKQNSCKPIEVIEIEDDDEEVRKNIQSDSKLESEDFTLPEQSFMQLLTNESKLNVSTTEDLLDTVRELLETEPLLPNDIVKQFGNNSLQSQVNDMFSLFSEELSMKNTLKLWKSIMEVNFVEKTSVVNMFLKKILIKKIFTEQDSDCKSLFCNTFNSYPEEVNALVRDFLVKDTADLKIFRNNLRTLQEPHKNILLKSFVEDCQKLEHYQLDSVLCLLSSSADSKHLKMLVELMLSAAKDFTTEKSFGKLLLEVVHCMGVGVMHNEQQINYIIEIHKSIFKAQIVKALKASLQDLQYLSQSIRM